MKLPVRWLSGIAVFAVVTGLFVTPARAVAASPQTATGMVPLVVAVSLNVAADDRVGPAHLWQDSVTLDQTHPRSTLTDLQIILNPTSGPGFDFDLRPAFGQELQVGRYQFEAAPDSRSPYLLADVGGDGGAGGREVDILDLAADSSGQLVRFDVVFLAGTQFSRGAMYGELRMGEPEPADHLLSNRAFMFPNAPVGIAAVPATEWLQNTGATPITIGTPTFSGPNANDFSVVDSACPTSLDIGATCSFRVGYSPLGAGARSATMSIPVNGEANLVSLTGTSPTGTTEMFVNGYNPVDGGQPTSLPEGPDREFTVGGVYPLGTDVPGALGFAEWPTKPTPGSGWSISVSPPQGHGLTVGTFPVAVYHQPDEWGVDIEGGRGCERPSGSLTVRQVELDPAGMLARTDLTFVGTCDGAPIAASMRYRSTVNYPEVVTPGPAIVTPGTVVPISGTALPTRAVTVLFRQRGRSNFVARRVVQADVNGRFAIAYTATDDLTYYVQTDGYTPVQYTTQVAPTITAVHSVKRGGVVTLHGTAIPSTTVQLAFRSVSGARVIRTVAVDSSGHWSRAYTATAAYAINVQGLANGLYGTEIAVHVLG